MTLIATVACREFVARPEPEPVAVIVTTQAPEATAVIVVEPVEALVEAVATPGQPEAAFAALFAYAIVAPVAAVAVVVTSCDDPGPMVIVVGVTVSEFRACG
ncbi:MAG: hypothetical protein IT358_09585 [Gemmatimonadaceae bacterium]|jgi:hypothetical protein|nr:hypothetical protein [Gemmatimonadaceae bacterium]